MGKMTTLLAITILLTGCVSSGIYQERFQLVATNVPLPVSSDDDVQVNVSLRSLRLALLTSEMYDALVVNHNADAQVANSIIDAYNTGVKRYWKDVTTAAAVGAAVSALTVMMLFSGVR
jgi:hypothetical protein